MKKQNGLKRTVEKIPTYCLNYLINAEIEGLIRQEVEDIDLWWKAWGVEIVSPINDSEPYFSRYPLFGLPTDVVDCVILYRNDI